MKMDKKIKLICTDIDGTLLDSNRDIAMTTATKIMTLNGKIPVILASSRMPSAMYYIQQKLDISGSPMIAYNGGLVLDGNNQTLYSATLPYKLLSAIIDHHQDKKYNISTFCNDIWRTESMDEWTLREINNTRVEPEISPLDNLLQKLKQKNEQPHKIMCMGDAKELNDLLIFIENMGLTTTANFYRSKRTYLEISAKNINKSKALQLLLDKVYGFTMEEVMAFGDNHNDIELLEHAGFGVAVANATENAKKAAVFVSDLTNKEGAVAEAVEKFLL